MKGLKSFVQNHFYEDFKNEIENSKRPRMLRILFYAICAVIILWSSTYFILKYMAKPGEIGDAFGMANALFSALAFALLIYTSLLQREELRLQRKEIAENREELKRSADAQKDLVKDRIINVAMKFIDDINLSLREGKFTFKDAKGSSFSNQNYLSLITNWHNIRESNAYFSGQINLILKTSRFLPRLYREI